MELSSPLLRLRELRLDDEAACHAFAADPSVARHTDWGPNTLADTQSFLRDVVAATALRPRTRFALAVTLPEGLLIGTAEVRVTSSENQAGEVGYTMHPAHWGQGLATEATWLLVAFGFDELELHRIAATCRAENIGSRRVLEKNGFRLEGQLRDHKLICGEWRDSLLLAVLAPT